MDPHRSAGHRHRPRRQETDALKRSLEELTGKQVQVNVLEVKDPELEAQLVAQGVAEQLAGRVAFRRAMRRALQSTLKAGAEGIRIQVSVVWAAPR